MRADTSRYLTVIGVPSSAGAYGPGQEKAPAALRAAGLIDLLRDKGITVIDKKDIRGFRWKVDPARTNAMNVSQAAEIAGDLAEKIRRLTPTDGKMMVIGGDCSIELGVVAGWLYRSARIGLIYFDFDTDLNVPSSVKDGALDWMGVAHMLNVNGSVDALATLAKNVPMLRPDQVHLFANGNMEDFEKDIIREYKIAQTPFHQVVANPRETARAVSEGWAHQFDHILIHLDVDVLDFVDFQIAENYRRNIGLTFHQMFEALDELLKMPNWAVLTITEINPDHTDENGLRVFCERISELIGKHL